ncbi:uncharacterized protein V1510DRAFT_288354 [Dipodascopsis tothii]|uniref:uncharacterized protein n=1 Tax=Dipodascopsis tothii TaxID=44089 RepID=UPI0034CF7BD0
MSAVGLLTGNLASLFSETKRRNAELRQACEKSTAVIKQLAAADRPEAAVFEDLARTPDFVTPFVLACATRNVKSSAIAIQSIQRLILSHGLSPTILGNVLKAFQEAAHLNAEIQLKILQTLPPLIENYGPDLCGDLIARTLEICSLLQSSKIAVVVNTAAATLQQLIVAVFDEVVKEDSTWPRGRADAENDAVAATLEAQCGDDGTKIPVKPAACDAQRIFQDVCFLTEARRATFLHIGAMSETFGLELIESIISNHLEVFLTHPEQTYILKSYVIPLILRTLSERHEFAVTVRTIRILYLILRRHLSTLPVESEVALSLLVHLLDVDDGHAWKRILVMEVFQGIFSEFGLVRKIYAEYDSQDGRQPILKLIVGKLNKISAEQPSVTGPYRRGSGSLLSSIKETASEAAAADLSTVAGFITGAVGLTDAAVPVLSVQTSSVRVLCIDQLDKTEPPQMPDTYLYYLVLTCINALADGMARFLLPLSVPEPRETDDAREPKDAKDAPPAAASTAPSTASTSPATPTARPRRKTLKYRGIAVNPLALDAHPLKADIAITAAIVSDCWPALLAAFSTYMYAPVDSELFHNIVRAFQKVTQSAGLLRLATPRDAFLTTLGKIALATSGPAGANGDGFAHGVKEAADPSAPKLNIRNLLCLRALLNLGIALGPTLKDSWTIILETLESADLVMHASARRTGRSVSMGSAGRADSGAAHEPAAGSSVAAETTAVENAVRKLLECSRDFPDDSFLDMINALCKVSALTINMPSAAPLEPARSETGSVSGSVSGDDSKPPSPLKRQRSGVGVARSHGDSLFAIAKLGELAELNIARLVTAPPDASGWSVLVSYLIRCAAYRETNSATRIKAAEVLNAVILSAIVEAAKRELGDDLLEPVQKRCLLSLEEQMYAIIRQGHPTELELSAQTADAEIQCTTLNTLNEVLDRTGSSLTDGWDTVFSTIAGIFVMHYQGSLLPTTPVPDDVLALRSARPKTSKSENDNVAKLVKAAFGSVQLICSDFLEALPPGCFLVLIDVLFYFCEQHDDLNISLTTVTFFWTVSDFLRAHAGSKAAPFRLSTPVRTKAELLALVRSPDRADAGVATWIVLLLRLTAICSDARSEVRNGAVQILFRIFDTYGHLLDANSWAACLWIVVLTVMEVRPPADMPVELVDAGTVQARDMARKQWSETMGLILSGLARLYSTYIAAIARQDDFDKIWATLIRYLQLMVDFRRPEVAVSVFKSLADMLDGVANAALDFPVACLDRTWDLWTGQEAAVAAACAQQPGPLVQQAVTAYVNAFKPLYGLLGPHMTLDRLAVALRVLQACLLASKLPPYYSDANFPTPLQAVVLDVLGAVQTTEPGSASLVLRSYATFSSFAYQDALFGGRRKPDEPTLIGVSTAAFAALPAAVRAALWDATVFTDGSLAYVLEMLVVPMRKKYRCPKHETDDAAKLTLWMLATNTFEAVAEAVIPEAERRALEPDAKHALWRQIIAGVCAVLRSNLTEPGPDAARDEDFDMATAGRLHALVIGHLGDQPPAVVDDYLATVFDCSLLYEVDNLTATAEPDIERQLDAIFHEPLYGTTEYRTLRLRRSMAYRCLDTLFALCMDLHTADPSARVVAHAAIKYLLMRCAIVLHNYAADQPLRGTIPVPSLQRKELVYLLTKLLELERHLDDEIDRDGPGLHSGHALVKLFPLLSKSLTVSTRDTTVMRLLQSSFEQIGKGIGAE